MSERLTPPVPELGHLADLPPEDGSPYFAKPLVDWARANFNQPGVEVTPFNNKKDMMGETGITLSGQPARLGWMKVGMYKVLNPYHISSPERLTILQGSVTLRHEDIFIKLSAPSEPDQESDIQSAHFGTGSVARFSDPRGPEDGKCWYLFTPI